MPSKILEVTTSESDSYQIAILARPPGRNATTDCLIIGCSHGPRRDMLSSLDSSLNLICRLMLLLLLVRVLVLNLADKYQRL
jgi:hypothetical protein